jgi:hypothetical protein
MCIFDLIFIIYYLNYYYIENRRRNYYNDIMTTYIDPAFRDSLLKKPQDRTVQVFI